MRKGPKSKVFQEFTAHHKIVMYQYILTHLVRSFQWFFLETSAKSLQCKFNSFQTLLFIRNIIYEYQVTQENFTSQMAHSFPKAKLMNTNRISGLSSFRQNTTQFYSISFLSSLLPLSFPSLPSFIYPRIPFLSCPFLCSSSFLRNLNISATFMVQPQPHYNNNLFFEP